MYGFMSGAKKNFVVIFNAIIERSFNNPERMFIFKLARDDHIPLIVGAHL